MVETGETDGSDCGQVQGVTVAAEGGEREKRNEVCELGEPDR